jgi:ABC-type uncharacterized transport system involved in gliding motility auxiliary subunit
VVGDAARAQRVRVGDPRMPTVDYVAWLHLSADDVSHDDPVTKDLQSLNIATAGALRPVTGATTKFTPLVMSSANAALLEAIEVRMTQNPQDLLRRFLPTGERYALAALDVVVIADADFIDDRFWVNVENQGGRRMATQFADNSTLLMNAAENMMGRSDLITLRSRSRAQRPFTVVQDLRRDAEIRFLAEAQSLQRRVQQAEASLRSLQGQAPQGGAQGGQMLTPAQEAEVERFRKVLVETRARLREVQANLRRDVVNLGNVLAFINIALVPILVAAAALGLAMIRRRRRTLARNLT